jgi:hypothetical protein
MGRHSVHRYRPLHSVHGPLYWAVLMWPVLLMRAVKARAGADRDSAERADPGLETRAPASTPRLPATAFDTWQVGEGGVAPLWDERPVSALR